MTETEIKILLEQKYKEYNTEHRLVWWHLLRGYTTNGIK